MSQSIDGRTAVRLLQGYLWHPLTTDIDLEQFLPKELETHTQNAETHVLWDQINPPFAFFDNGDPTATQTFYQFTVLSIYEQKPSTESVAHDAQIASTVLQPLLETTPNGVGWQLWEDGREL